MSSPAPTPARRSTRAQKPTETPRNIGHAGPARSTRVNAVAGPSTPSPRVARRSTGLGRESGAVKASGDGVQTPPGQQGSSRRVLPARIRRAAGGGQEGIRDLEEMIVDWLERWGLPLETPPDSLPIYLSTLPLNLVHPPTRQITTAQPQPVITLTPTRSTPAQPIPSPRRADLTLESGKIETPGWVIVRPGDDDAEEARAELENRNKSASPLKRLRRLAPEEGGEDTSDAYYMALHRKYEIFERRQRIREKEKLIFERYKMRSRIELLRNMSSLSWATVVNTVLSREGDPSWTKGRELLRRKPEGIDWLRERLVKEGKELVKRYDQLLPVDTKKRTDRAPSIAASTPTPERVLESSPRHTPSPPPVLPARVTALREPNSQKRSRATSSPSARETSQKPIAPKPAAKQMESEYDDPSILLPRKRKRPVLPPQPAVYTQTKLNFVKIEPKIEPKVPTPSPVKSPSPPAPESSSRSSERDPDRFSIPSDSSRTSHTASVSGEPFHPPVTVSGLPCLIEAASRREAAIEEAEAARAKVEARKEASDGGEKVSRILAREKTRTSGRLGLVLPFGMPFPPVLEWKSEFTITDEEDFWGIIAEREAQANMRRRSSVLGTQAGNPSLLARGTDRVTQSPESVVAVSKEDVADMREVEAAVVP